MLFLKSLYEKALVYFLSFLFNWGVAFPKTASLVIPKDYSTIHYGFSILQTSKDYQIGDEFL